MGKYKVTGPDGQQFVITTPDGATADDAVAFAQDRFKSLQQQGVGNIGKVGQGEAILRGLGQGATLNWGDEIYGYGKNLPKLVTEGGSQYLDAARNDTAAVRDRNKAASEQNPTSYLGGELGGSLLPLAGSYLLSGLTGGGAAPAATAQTARITGMGSKMLQGARAGAPVGMIAGAGGAESSPNAGRWEIAENTAAGTLWGGLLGGGIGAAIPPVASALGTAAGVITKPMQAAIYPDRFAASKAAEALMRGNDGLTPLQIAQKAAQQAQDAPGTMLADVGGKPMRDLMRAAINQPNSGTTGFLKALSERQKTQHQVIEDKLIKPAYGDVGNFDTALKDLVKQRSAAADPAFKDAFSSEFRPSQELLEIFQTPLLDRGGPIYKKVINDLSAEHPREFGAGTYTGRNLPISGLEQAHRAKVEIQNMIDWQANPLSRLDRSSSENISDKSLKSLHGQFMSALGKSEGDGVKKYFDAIGKYGDDSGVMRAMKLGEATGRGESPEGLAEFMRSATQAERDGYRLGMGRAVQEQNRSGAYGADRVRRDWDSPLRDQQLQSVLPPPAPPGANGAAPQSAFDRIQAIKNALNEQTATRQAAVGNSTTAGQLLAAQDSAKEAEQVKQGVKAAIGAAQGNLSPLLAMAESKLDRLRGMTPKVSAEVLRLAQHPAAYISGQSAWTFDPAIQALIEKQVASQAQMPALFNRATRGLLGPSTENRSRD